MTVLGDERADEMVCVGEVQRARLTTRDEQEHPPLVFTMKGRTDQTISETINGKFINNRF